MLTQDQLQSEIRAWSSEALETKQDNGHATCPYAKNTWNKQKVKILKPNTPNTCLLYTSDAADE